MNFIIALLDRLFPPTFGRITASFELAKRRLRALAVAETNEATRQVEVARVANLAALVANAEADRARKVVMKLDQLINP